MQLKYELYQESGVTDYWIIFPNDEAVHKFVLDKDQRYQLKAMYAEDDIAIPHVFPDFPLDLKQIFELYNHKG